MYHGRAMTSRLAALLVAGVATTALGAGDPPGFALWTASELTSHDAALSTHVADDHSSRETLADYGGHRVRMLYRDADGNPEQHDAIIDIVVVQSGGGVLQLGGSMSGRRATSAGESVGTRLDGGERHAIGPGDIVHIPAGVPHAFLVTKGAHLTYVLLKIPAR